MFPFSSTWIRSSAKNRTKRNSARFSRSWNSAHSSIGYSKGKRQFVLPYSNLSGTRPLCRDSVCPAANLHSRKQRPDSRRFVCKFAGEGTGVSENSNLTRLEMLDIDYQLIDTEDKRAEIIQKLLTSEILSIDTETTGTEPMDAELVGMSFSDAENRAYYVPVPAEREEVLKL